MTNKQPCIMLFGANGQLGQTFAQLLAEVKDFSIIMLGKQDIDITNEESVKAMIQAHNPQYVINCAAYTAVDKAETDVEACYAVNKDACGVLVRSIEGMPCKLIHFSTDYVYHLAIHEPLREDMETNPQGVYAQSKCEGEAIIRKSAVPYCIIRTSWVVSPFGHNFVKTMLRLGKEKEQLNVVNDQHGAITFTYDLANVVVNMIHNDYYGSLPITVWNETYNYANGGISTWFAIATRIMQIANYECKVLPIPSDQYPTPAKRPSWSVMDTGKIERSLGIHIRPWEEALEECVKLLMNG